MTSLSSPSSQRSGASITPHAQDAQTIMNNMWAMLKQNCPQLAAIRDFLDKMDVSFHDDGKKGETVPHSPSRGTTYETSRHAQATAENVRTSNANAGADSNLPPKPAPKPRG